MFGPRNKGGKRFFKRREAKKSEEDNEEIFTFQEFNPSSGLSVVVMYIISVVWWQWKQKLLGKQTVVY